MASQQAIRPNNHCERPRNPSKDDTNCLRSWKIASFRDIKISPSSSLPFSIPFPPLRLARDIFLKREWMAGGDKRITQELVPLNKNLFMLITSNSLALAYQVNQVLFLTSHDCPIYIFSHSRVHS